MTSWFFILRICVILPQLCKHLWFYLFKTATEIRHFSETPKTVMQLIATKLVLTTSSFYHLQSLIISLGVQCSGRTELVPVNSSLLDESLFL